jgi:hypothetical protein
VAHHAAEAYVGADEEVNVGGGRNRSLSVEFFDLRLLNLPEAFKYHSTNTLTFLQGNSFIYISFLGNFFTHFCLVLLPPLLGNFILQKELAIEFLPALPLTILLKYIFNYLK